MDPNQNMPMDPNAMGQDPALNQGAPVDPNAAPDPNATGQQMATPEQKAQLMDMMNQIEAKYREMNAEKFAGSNKAESAKKDLVIEVFKALQNAGIDPTNVESVRMFLDDLQQSNPDLYSLFVDAFNSLIGGETDAATPAQDQTGALGAMPGAAGNVGMPGTPAPAGPETIPGGVPSNDGLAGMAPAPASPPEAGMPMANKFPNLAK